jgi:septum site-determining protein MinC
MSEAVSFKGNKDGIVLLLDLSVEFEALCQMIVQKLWESRNFLGDHTSLIINSGAIALNDGQRLALKVLLQSLGHEVKYFLPEVPVEGTPKAAEQKISEPKVPDNKVYEPKVSAPKTVVPEVPAQTEAEVSSISELADIEHYLTKSALAVRKNIRSGQKISYDGTLIIFGDVNAGAELEAAGHILVLGALRGVAHAGCKGDKKAVIYANQLRSVQLRIADLIARAPDGENTKRNIPEIARIIDNYLVIEEV